MKNLIIYISPTGSFNNPQPNLSNDAGQLVKVQIENSLRLEWKKEDIMLVTNFDFQYGVIKAINLDIDFFEKEPQASKFNAVVELFNNNLIKENDMYRLHDLDAFQLQPITKKEIKIAENEIAMSQYSIWARYRWNAGSVFFKKGSKDIFIKLKNLMYENVTGRKLYDEEAFENIMKYDKKLAKRIKKINKTYNFTPLNYNPRYEIAKKPIKVAHFRPSLGIPITYKEDVLIPDRLIKIFKYHRIT